MPFTSLPGRHVTAAEALQLGILDQVTEHSTVDVAVKFALSIAGEASKEGEKERKKEGTRGMKSLLLPDGGDETFHPEQLFWAGPTSRSVDVGLVKVDGSRKQDRQIFHHRSYKCFMALSEAL